MERYYNELKDIVNELQDDVTKFYEKGNDTAGVRIRVALQKVRENAFLIRQDISAIKKAKKIAKKNNK